MATSGIYAYTTNRDTILRLAALAIGLLGETESLNPQQTIDMSNLLNMMVKQWMGKQDFAPGLKMWTRQRATLFLSSTKHTYYLGPTGDQWAASVATSATATHATSQLTAQAAALATTITVGLTNILNYTAGDYVVIQLNSGDIYSTTVSSVNTGAGTFVIPGTGLPSIAGIGNYAWNYTTKAQRPLELVTALLRDVNNTDTPLDYMTIQTYEALPTKTMLTFVSDPTSVYYEPQLGNGVLYLDVGGAQDVTKRLHIVYLRPIQSFVNPLDEPEYSQEWYLPLCLGLGKLAAPMYNKQWSDLMESNYTSALTMARETNPEVTELFFQPSSRSVYSA